MSAPQPRHPRRPVPAIALSLGAASALLLGGCATSGEPAMDRSVEAVPLTSTGITQTVVPRGDDFARFEVRTATYGQPGPADGALVLTVSDGTQHREVAVGPVGIGDNTWVPLPFEPFTDSAGRQFTATVRWTGTSALAVWTNPNDSYLDGWMEPGPGDLVFRVGHAGRLTGTADAAGRIASETVDNLGDEPFTVVAWVAALLGAATLLRRRSDAPSR